MFTFSRKVQYHETDKMGITHHSNYIKWMEESRIALLEHIGLPFQSIEEKGIVSPVTGLSIDYKSPCTFGDEISIEVTISKYTGIRLEINYSMLNFANNTIVACSSSKHCFMKDDRIISLKKTEPEMHEILKSNIFADD